MIIFTLYSLADCDAKNYDKNNNIKYKTNNILDIDKL